MNVRFPAAFALPLSLTVTLTAADPRTPAPTSAAGGDRLRAGRLVYDQHCAACHGQNGDGDGPAAVWLFPKPRNFSAGLFKIQSTPPGSLPADEDLLHAITRGMPGSSMPAFSYLGEADRRAVMEYVKHLTATTDESGKRVNLFEAARARGELKPPIPVPPEPPVTFEALTRGKEVFTALQCAACHGETGAGDGPAAPTLRDSRGLPLPPRDFNTGALRGGHTGRDLYLRIATGMAGTPMPPYPDELVSPQDRWALVHYIQSLRRKDVEISDILAPAEGRISARRFRGPLPAEPTDPRWEKLEAVRVPLNPLWPEPDPITAVAVRAVHDGRRLAILLQWRDATPNQAPVRVEDFQDAVALQFALGDTPPFLGMGDARHPVNLWMWRADWQQAAGGRRPDVDTLHPAMHVDLYPEAAVLYRTAEAAGNLLARPAPRSAVEDANARGFGTFVSQPARGQNVAGRGAWLAGHWNVVVARELRSRDANDVRFTAGRPVPVAFAVWDGEQRDRNGRKAISNWYQLVLEK